MSLLELFKKPVVTEQPALGMSCPACSGSKRVFAEGHELKDGRLVRKQRSCVQCIDGTVPIVKKVTSIQ